MAGRRNRPSCATVRPSFSAPGPPNHHPMTLSEAQAALFRWLPSLIKLLIRRKLEMSVILEGGCGLPARAEKMLSEAGQEDLERWGLRLLDATSLEDVFATT